MVQEGEAIRHTESEGYASGGGHKGVGGGSYSGESTGYWLCYPCHQKRKNINFWIGFVVVVILIIIGFFLYFKFKN